MSFGSWWRRVVGRAPPEPARPPAEPSEAPPPAVQAPVVEAHPLSLLGTAEGPSEAKALEILGRAAGTPAEREAIAAVASAIAQRELPESVASRCAVLLADRGDRATALQFLERATLPSNLLLRADLLSETGQLALAMSLMERILARDIDYPGARERHERWRALVNPGKSQPRGRSDVTIAVPTDRNTPFRILREVARGGSGTIYEAQDEVLGRTVAFKLYHRAEADREQLEREARIAISLRGPGVVRVYDASFADGWLAIEWVPLGSVRDLLAAGRVDALTPMEPWVQALAGALSRVHAAGIVHADVKPANVLLRAPGEPVLCDFGIAVPNASATLGGSAGYLSPERLEGRLLTPSDDVYALGRVIEDVLGERDDRRMRRLAGACLASKDKRPQNAGEVLKLMA
ncbi:MAG: serine/threonine protein kinase [Deltaproteobacteria bacterium]|nr:serine/threonine protein kinase [Deltaproteobacteria bacterium]